MFEKYFLLFILHAHWAYSVFPLQLRGPKDVGEPLFLTPLIKSNRTDIARSRSTVEEMSNEYVTSYSGYFTVDESNGSNLFFWFFQKTGKNWKKAPLLLWLQGGPGLSSMFGLFEENGPFIVTEEGLEWRDYTWINEFNVIYIDQPVGTGFSFPQDDITIEKAADHLYEAMKQFFQLFPKFSSNAFYITGEGFASKFVTALGYKIHNMRTCSSSFNLKGLFMISPRINGFVNGLANFCFQVGIIDSYTKEKLVTMEKRIQSYINSESWTNASDLTKTMFSKIQKSSSVDLNHFTKPNTCMPENYVDFLKKAEIRKKIHVGKYIFSNYDEFYSLIFHEEEAKSVVPWLEKLLEYYPIAFVAGQLDARVAYPLVVNALQNLSWSRTEEYSHAKRRLLVDEELLEDYGYYRSAGNLKEILIRDAGHMVSIDQPRATLDVLKKFVNDEL